MALAKETFLKIKFIINALERGSQSKLVLEVFKF